MYKGNLVEYLVEEHFFLDIYVNGLIDTIHFFNYDLNLN